MTDDRIIKVLECCINDDCDNCPDTFGNCEHNAMQKALDLINRQKAEIEDLTVQKEKQRLIIESIDGEVFPLPFETDYDKAIQSAKSEAIKEFWGTLKSISTLDERIVSTSTGDNLVKEMIGDKQ